MKLTDNAIEYINRMAGGKAGESALAKTDPEFYERFMNFAYDEVVNEEGWQLDDRMRFISILAVLLGCQGIDEFKVNVPAALNFGVTPVEIKEIVYQANDYLGMGRIFQFLLAVNEIFRERGIELPLEPQGTTTMEDRLAKGNQVQIDAFGEGMRERWLDGPEEMRHINRWLASNCFGDFYTRTGLSIADRELITFCFIYAQGGAESQLAGHVNGNLNVGNDRHKLISVVSQCIPYIGYPRSLNAVRVVQEVSAQREAAERG